ncbi:trypsin alpha-like, partial [Drosophila subpulchrella]|uniref:trypsin alpha-like n=1 Tax=Drosophila subpulchrella TaxID=1486046 RepID=UPI0018A19704
SKVSSKLVEMFFSCFLLLFALKIEQAPWQVSLQTQGHHICGGSIYSKDIATTAAHCFFTKDGRQLPAEDFIVRAGSAIKNSGGALVKVAAIRTHEMFEITNFNYDIAVMRLSEALELTHKVQTIPLAEKNPARGTPAFSSGWGYSLWFNHVKGSVELISPVNLQGVQLEINSSDNDGMILKIPKDVISAGSFGQTACRGDSGGPLVVNQQLVGVVASGPQWCDGDADFTSVPYFREWILNTIESI